MNFPLKPNAEIRCNVFRENNIVGIGNYFLCVVVCVCVCVCFQLLALAVPLFLGLCSGF